MAARLGQDKALEVKQMIASGKHASLSEVARLTGVSVATVSRIANGAAWADVAIADPPASVEQTFRERLLGKRRRGGRRPTRLTEAEVRQIKQRLLGEETLRDIASDYSIDFSYVGRIARGENWSHVSPWEGVDPGPLRRQRRLTAEEVSVIRSRKSESAVVLAAEFAVHHSTVRDIRSGRTRKSDRRDGAKLTATTARELRERLERGEPPEELANEYEISRTTLWRVRTGRSWR